jgi:hypothetical protein
VPPEVEVELEEEGAELVPSEVAAELDEEGTELVASDVPSEVEAELSDEGTELEFSDVPSEVAAEESALLFEEAGTFEDVAAPLLVAIGDEEVTPPQAAKLPAKRINANAFNEFFIYLPL